MKVWTTHSLLFFEITPLVNENSSQEKSNEYQTLCWVYTNVTTYIF